jgi:hypothetical protein
LIRVRAKGVRRVGHPTRFIDSGKLAQEWWSGWLAADHAVDLQSVLQTLGQQNRRVFNRQPALRLLQH